MLRVSPKAGVESQYSSCGATFRGSTLGTGAKHVPSACVYSPMDKNNKVVCLAGHDYFSWSI